MSIVKTATTTSGAVPLVLRLTSKIETEAAVNQLSTILDRFRAEPLGDPLSLRLFRWGHEVLVAAAEYGLDEKRNVLQIVQTKVDELVRDILVSQPDGVPLIDPVLDGEITWERGGVLWTDYQSVRTDTTAPRTHLFAKEILQWMRETCLIVEDIPTISGSEVAVAVLSEMSPEAAQMSHMMRFFGYQQLVSRVRAIVHHQKMQELIAQEREQIASLTVRMQEMTRRALARAEQRCREHELSIQTRIQEIEGTHAAHRAELERQLEAERISRGDAVATLEGLIEIEKQTNRATVDTLNGQAAALRDALNDTAAKLTQQSASMEGQVKGLSHAQRNEIEAVALQHRTTIEDIEQRSHIKVSGLQAQLSQIQAESSQLRTALIAAQNTSASQGATIAYLQQQSRQQEQLIIMQQHEIDDANSSCAVM